MITPPTPSEVIPIGERPLDIPPPTIKRQDPPPRVKAPEKVPEKVPEKAPEKAPAKPPEKPPVKPVEVKKPVPATPPRPTTDSAVDNLIRKREAEAADLTMEARLADLAKQRGAGNGSASENNSGNTEGARIDPIKTHYYNQIKDIVRSNWVAPLNVFGANGNIGNIYVIVIQPDGRISGKNLRQPSGNLEFDQSVEQAIVRSNFPPLPPVFENRADNPALRFELSYLNRNG
jgi:outer membrane biosynthesis protein TonB